MGLSFVVEACVLLYCWAFYPEFRRVFAEASVADDAATAPLEETRSWSHYASTATADSSSTPARDETESLLLRGANSDPGVVSSSSVYNGNQHP